MTQQDIYQAIKQFHLHLDACVQCREHPFALCPEGNRRVEQAMQAIRASGQKRSVYQVSDNYCDIHGIELEEVPWFTGAYEECPKCKRERLIREREEQGLPIDDLLEDIQDLGR
jgi:hypothetical protein